MLAVHVVSSLSGVRNYLKEALVNIITVHAEVISHFLNITLVFSNFLHC